MSVNDGLVRFAQISQFLCECEESWIREAIHSKPEKRKRMFKDMADVYRTTPESEQ